MSSTPRSSNVPMTSTGMPNDAHLHVVATSVKSRSMTPAVTLVFCLDETLDISVRHDGAHRDMRGRWDKVQWRHYRVMAGGLQQILSNMLGLSIKRIKTDGSLLCSETTAVPRLVVEVPEEFKDSLATEDVREVVRDFVDQVMGRSANDGSTDEASGVPAQVLCPEEAVAPTTESPEPVSPRVMVATVAAQVLSKIGGVTLPVQCHLEMEGWSGPVASMSGRCADKPVLVPSEPRDETMECFVDGFIMSRHTAYLIPCGSNGVAKEVAMSPEWESQVAQFALSRGHRFIAQIRIVQQGQKSTRELVSLTKATIAPQNCPEVRR